MPSAEMGASTTASGSSARLDLFAAGSFSVRGYHILRVQCVFFSSEAIISQARVRNLKDDTTK
jgi:hypothetical protein